MKVQALILITVIFISALNANLNADTDHEHLHQGLPDKSWFLDQIFELYSNQTTITQNNFKDIIQKLNIDYHDHDEHDHNDHDHYRSLLKSKSDNLSLCYTSDQILSIFHLHNPNALITKSLFQEMSPALIWLNLNIECHTHEHDHEEVKICETSNIDKYLYGSLSVVLIWLISMICVSLLGKFKESLKLLTLALKGLAIGTLLSDALLHIIPTALGVHSHDHSGDDHSHDNSTETERDHRDPMWKMTVTLANL
ncbi:zinc transporter ZIP4 [Brachionus plicatilis]|uniref:Zinc transporter ZIP4 n=1 Tax=Brachionus plicatilis TaxID=10195 RepID=A0A3M7RB80_BRAPC|nr:zinc transporter ZIP4 [Brachionus plicatilis]